VYPVVLKGTYRKRYNDYAPPVQFGIILAKYKISLMKEAFYIIIFRNERGNAG
jgi:hypothetical protein